MPWLIGLDWGTSSFGPCFSMAKATCMRHANAHGASAIFRKAVSMRRCRKSAVIGPCPTWRRAWSAAGRAGAKSAYVDTPADIRPWPPTSSGAQRRRRGIIPGVRERGALDVMRGEETQVIGALALRPELAGRPPVAARYAQQVDRGARRPHCAFATMMTGELYAMLREHSILGAAIPTTAAEVPKRSTPACVRRATAAAGADALFSARALMLDGDWRSTRCPITCRAC